MEMLEHLERFTAANLMVAARALLSAALLCCPAEAVLSRQPKRHRPEVVVAAGDLLSKAAELLHITLPQFVYHADSAESRHALIDALWAGTWTESVASRFSDANQALCQLFEAQLLDGDEMPARFRLLQGQSRWEAVMSALFRARTQKWVPIETAAMSIMWLYYRVPKSV